jgi:hypothetical protein
MEWMATITGDHVGYPGGFGSFFSKENKIFGSENLHVFWCRIFAVESNTFVFIYPTKICPNMSQVFAFLFFKTTFTDRCLSCTVFFKRFV